MKFSCAACDGRIECEDNLAGQSMTCPNCGSDVFIPGEFIPPSIPQILMSQRPRPFPLPSLVAVAVAMILVLAGTLYLAKLLRDRDALGGPPRFVIPGERLSEDLAALPVDATEAGAATSATPASATPAYALAGLWPQWRGPQRDGISPETGLLDSWPEDGPPLAWRMQGLGKGYSSVSMAGGRLYTMGRPADSDDLIAVDLQTHAILWSTHTGEGGNDGPRCTPTIDGDRVYALSSAGNLLCANATTGHEIWTADYKRDFAGNMMSDWGYCESPLVDGDKLVCVPGGPRGTVVALDKNSGHVLWKCNVPKLGNQGSPGAGYTGAVISDAAGVRQYVVLLGQGVAGISADGHFLWGYNRVANSTANIPTPLVSGDYVFASTGYGAGAALLKLSRKANHIQAREVYFLEANQFQNHHGNMVLVDGYIYAGHGHDNGLPICIHFDTGKIAWGPERGPGRNSAAVIYADGHLYFRYQNGIMALIEATPKGYNLTGQFKIAAHNGESWSHPAIADGHLYLRDQHELLCYDIRK